MNKKGFTLIEMLVVVAIIAILASVFLVGLRGFRGSAYDARRLSDMQKVQGYLEIYYNKHRVYPDVDSWADLKGELVDDNITTQIPSDPIAGGDADSDYQYAQCDNGQGYALGARLSDVGAAAWSDSVTPGGSCTGGGFVSSCFDGGSGGEPASTDYFCVKF